MIVAGVAGFVKEFLQLCKNLPCWGTQAARRGKLRQPASSERHNAVIVEIRRRDAKNRSGAHPERSHDRSTLIVLPTVGIFVD